MRERMPRCAMALLSFLVMPFCLSCRNPEEQPVVSREAPRSDEHVAQAAVPPSGPPAVIPAVYRFEEHLPEATQAEAAPVDQSPGTFIPVIRADRADVWTVSKPGSRAQWAESLFTFITQEADAATSPGTFELFGPLCDRLRVRMSVSGVDELELVWCYRGAEWSYCEKEGGCHVRLLVPEQGKELGYEVLLSDLPAWDQHVVTGFRISVGGAAEIRVRSIEVVNKANLFAEDSTGTKNFSVDRCVRPCLYAHAPARLTWRVPVPERAVFSAGLTVLNTDRPVRFYLEAGTGDTAKRLWEEEIAAPGAWKDMQVDLGALAGSEQLITLGAACTEGGQVALWSNPEVAQVRAPQNMPGASKEAPNIVLYIVDALRADHLNAYGYGRETAPNLARVAGEGVRFANCLSQATCTKTSMASLATGADQLLHGFTCFAGEQIPAELAMYPELMRRAGYETCVISENPYTPPPAGERRAYSISEELDEVSAAVTGTTYEKACRFLEGHRERPFFLYVHTMECHSRRTPHMDQFGYDPPEAFKVAWDTPQNASPAEQYDASIAFADQNFERLRAKLEELGLLENTIIVFTSDHGEALGERGGQTGHGLAPYQEQIHVPLVFYGKGRLPGGTVIDELVQLSDLPDTILDFCGVTTLPQFQGCSLRPCAERGDLSGLENRGIFSFNGWASCCVAVTRGPWRLLTTCSDEWQLLNYVDDPGESQDFAGGHREVFEELKAAIEAHRTRQAETRAGFAGSATPVETLTIDPVKQDVLDSFGYLGD